MTRSREGQPYYLSVAPNVDRQSEADVFIDCIRNRDLERYFCALFNRQLQRFLGGLTHKLPYRSTSAP
jgi:hypothetical protein